MRTLILSLITAVALVAAYSFYVVRHPNPIIIPQSIGQDNTLKAQQFIYNHPEQMHTIILGSSLAAKLRAEALPEGTYNLSLRGRTVLDGFEVLLRAGARPRLILVETNTLERARSLQQVKALFNPIAHPLRKAAAGTLEQNNPLNRLFALAFDVLETQNPKKAREVRLKLGAPVPGKAAYSGADLTEKPADKDKARLLEKIIAEQTRNQNRDCDRPRVERNLMLMQDYIKRCEARGAKVVFVRFPMGCHISHGRLQGSMQQMLHEAFPADRYTYLPETDCHTYQTSDGEHLTDASALRYTLWLNTYLK